MSEEENIPEKKFEEENPKSEQVNENISTPKAIQQPLTNNLPTGQAMNQ